MGGTGRPDGSGRCGARGHRRAQPPPDRAVRPGAYGGHQLRGTQRGAITSRSRTHADEKTTSTPSTEPHDRRRSPRIFVSYRRDRLRRSERPGQWRGSAMQAAARESPHRKVRKRAAGPIEEQARACILAGFFWGTPSITNDLPLIICFSVAAEHRRRRSSSNANWSTSPAAILAEYRRPHHLPVGSTKLRPVSLAEVGLDARRARHRHRAACHDGRTG